MLREVSASAGTSRAVPALQSFKEADDLEALCDRALTAFLNHRIVTHLLRQLTLARFDLRTLTVAQRVWDSCSTSTVVPTRAHPTDGRITLAEIAAALDNHRALQRSLVAELARSFPGTFLVMFGQGIALAHRSYAERFSHDIDLLVEDPGDGQAIVEALKAEGFRTAGPRSGSYGGVAFHDWRLDHSNLDGHRMHIDISIGAVTNSNGWMRPVELPGLFDSARTVDMPDAGPCQVLVPSDGHQLVLVCEKAQRKHRYDARVRCDTAVLVRKGALDDSALLEIISNAGLAETLRWALGPDGPRTEPRRRGWRDAALSALIAAMAHRAYRPSLAHDNAARLYRRLSSHV